MSRVSDLWWWVADGAAAVADRVRDRFSTRQLLVLGGAVALVIGLLVTTSVLSPRPDLDDINRQADAIVGITPQVPGTTGDGAPAFETPTADPADTGEEFVPGAPPARQVDGDRVATSAAELTLSPSARYLPVTDEVASVLARELHLDLVARTLGLGETTARWSGRPLPGTLLDVRFSETSGRGVALVGGADAPGWWLVIDAGEPDSDAGNGDTTAAARALAGLGLDPDAYELTRSDGKVQVTAADGQTGHVTLTGDGQVAQAQLPVDAGSAPSPTGAVFAFSVAAPWGMTSPEWYGSQLAASTLTFDEVALEVRGERPVWVFRVGENTVVTPAHLRDATVRRAELGLDDPRDTLAAIEAYDDAQLLVGWQQVRGLTQPRAPVTAPRNR